MSKLHKPRKREHAMTFDLTVRDGNSPVVKLKEQKFSNLNEILEMLDKKL